MSVFLYAVRCNFAGSAAREADWHEWYNGPKLRQMLDLPLFLAVQRFAATALDARRKYLALWQVASPDAFATAEYRAQWGFAAWTDEITDWSRDLYRGPDEAGALLEIGADDALYLAAFDGMSEPLARERLAPACDRAPRRSVARGRRPRPPRADHGLAQAPARVAPAAARRDARPP